MKVVWTNRAAKHLHAAYEYRRREASEDSADEMLEHIFSAVELLENHPELGRLGRVTGTKELVLHPPPFLLAYRIRRNKIEVIALLHGSRKWPTKFD